jgi:hypothetical protein
MVHNIIFYFIEFIFTLNFLAENNGYPFSLIPQTLELRSFYGVMNDI